MVFKRAGLRVTRVKRLSLPRTSCSTQGISHCTLSGHHTRLDPVECVEREVGTTQVSQPLGCESMNFDPAHLIYPAKIQNEGPALCLGETVDLVLVVSV